MNREEFNKQIKSEGENVRRKLQYRIRTLSSKGKGDLAKSLRMRNRSVYGEIISLWWIYDVHGAFFQTGAGKGYKVRGGKVMRTASGKVTKPREAKDFVNPAIDSSFDKIANIAQEYHGDTVLNEVGKVIGVKKF